MKTSEETKEKLRNIGIDRRTALGQTGFNPEACRYIDELSLKMGWNLQHAKRGGEFRVGGYLLDGYDKNKNIVVEYDEPAHYDVRGNLKQKDIDRMNTIVQYMGCQFYRYNEKLKELKKYN